MSPKPMLTEDYLIRQINLAIAALAKILGFKTAGQYQAALYEIDQLLEQLIGLRSYMIKNLSDEGILAILSNADGVDTDRLLLVAELLRHEADILAKKNYAADSAANYARSLNFYLEVQLSGGLKYLDPPDEQIEEMLNQLTGSEFPPETLFNLYVYFEQRGEYSRSESMLSSIAARTGWHEDLAKEHEDFYGRLLERSNQELELGGLSRIEVEQKLGQFRSLTTPDPEQGVAGDGHKNDGHKNDGHRNDSG